MTDNDLLMDDLTPNVTTPASTSNSSRSLDASNYINITTEMPIAYAVPLYGYIMPFLLIITIIANTLIVVVLSKRHMRSPTNVVLMAMALCDMFTVLIPAPWLIYMYTFGNHYKPLWPISLCYAWNAMHEVRHFYKTLSFIKYAKHNIPDCIFSSVLTSLKTKFYNFQVFCDYSLPSQFYSN